MRSSPVPLRIPSRTHTPDIACDYLDLADTRLAAVLTEEDRLEREHTLSPHDRLSCQTHRTWTHRCVCSPLHVLVVTGHRWCRNCRVAAEMSVDELTGSVHMRCPACRRMPSGLVNQQTVRACRRSLAAARFW